MVVIIWHLKPEFYTRQFGCVCTFVSDVRIRVFYIFSWQKTTYYKKNCINYPFEYVHICKYRFLVKIFFCIHYYNGLKFNKLRISKNFFTSLLFILFMKTSIYCYQIYDVTKIFRSNFELFRTFYILYGFLLKLANC